MNAELDAAVALASRLGLHAFALFACALPVLLIGVALAWWSFARWSRRREPVGLSLTAFLLLWASAGLTLLLGAAALFARFVHGLGAGEAMGHIDDAVAATVQQSLSVPALQALAVVTRLGNTATLTAIGVAVAAALLLGRRHGLACSWIAGVGGNAVLNVSLKQVFERVRPVHDGGIVVAEGYSFPSGHASGSVVTYGLLAYLALRLLPPPWHLPALLLATAAAFTTGCSRVFLRVHYLSDVAAGFTSGSAWLVLCIAGIEMARRYRSRTRR